MLSRPQGRNEAGRINAVKNPHNPVGNRTGDLPDGLNQPKHRCIL